MPYKDYSKRKERSLQYYYKNKEKVLAYQTQRWKKKYKTDLAFRLKRRLRDKSRVGKSEIIGKCVCCGSTEDLQRHYPNLFKNCFEVIISCRECHNKLHNSLKGKNCNQTSSVSSVMC